MRDELRAARRALFLFAVAVAVAGSIVQFVGLVAQPPPSIGAVLGLAVFTAATFVSALFVLWRPSRLFLSIAAIANLAALILWIVTRAQGLPDGATVWHPELLAAPDFFLPGLEGVAVFLFLCLLVRTFGTPPSWQRALHLLPWVGLAGVLLWAALNVRLAQVLLAIVILDAGVPASLLYLFVPAVVVLVALLCARFFSARLRARTPHAFGAGLALVFALFVLNLITAGAIASARDTAWLSRDAPVQATPGTETTLAYCWQDGHPLAMDLAEPTPARGAAPVVFFIHGGETLLGSRRLWDGSLDGRYFSGLREKMLVEGFAVGSIDYVLAPVYPRSDEVKDAKCAVRFLRAHAKALNIDPARIGVFGPSQGGYISAMLGTVPRNAGFDVGDHPEQSSRVEAVVDMWGPMDLANFSGSPKWVSAFTQGNSAANLRAASPINYVTPGDPPFLIVHGTDDWFIAPHHSIDMASKLRAARIPVSLVLVKNDGHGLAAATTGKTQSPSPVALTRRIDDFFVTTLGAHALVASPQ